jgi:Restriction Endonuclease associating with ARP
MDNADTLEHIKHRQKHWAESHAIPYDKANGRVPNLDDNLFAPLDADTVSEFSDADGSEFGKNGMPGKMFSLHSSSALVCNVFDYWRRRPLAPILRACGIEGSRNELRFEQKIPTGLGGTPPNLDVVLSCDGKSPVTAIESKFTEPYCSSDHSGFSASYFLDKKLWEGLEKSRELAENFTRPNFRYLNAAQLLKHTLGLRRRFTAGGFELLYLWYDVPGSSAAETLREEVERFSQAVSTEVRFRSLTYQELFGRLAPVVGETDYAAYLGSRYFPDLSNAASKN